MRCPRGMRFAKANSKHLGEELPSAPATSVSRRTAALGVHVNSRQLGENPRQRECVLPPLSVFAKRQRKRETMSKPRTAALVTVAVVFAAAICGTEGATNRAKNSVSQAFELRMAGKVDEAKDSLTQLLAEDPKDATAHFELARVHFYTMELDRALKEVEEAVALRPDNARYHYLKGMTEAYNMILKAHDPKTRGDMKLLAKKSLESFRRAVELDPKDHEARLQLINLCLKMPPEDGGGRAEAEKLVKQAETLDAVGGAKARCMLLGGRATEQQRDVWKKVVAKQPNSAGAHEGLGRAWLSLGDTNKAISHLDKALKLDPARSVILVDLARHYFFAKEYDKAERTAKRYLDFKPEPIIPMRAYSTFMIAKIHKVQKHHERAEELLVQARKIDPHLWQAVRHPPEVLFTAPLANGRVRSPSSEASPRSTSGSSRLLSQEALTKPKELDILGQYVGYWTSDVTSKPAVWTPTEIKYRTSNHAEFVLDGRFLHHIEVSHEIDNPKKVGKSLFLWTHDPKSMKYVGWIFQSSGNIVKATGTWDAASKTFTNISVEPPPNTTSQFTEAFPNDSTINGTLVFTGNDGETMFDMVWTRTRQRRLPPNPLRQQWATVGTPIKPLPNELKELQPLIGEWDSEFNHRPSVAWPEGSTSEGRTTTQWILDGRFLLGAVEVGNYKSMWTLGYDTNKGSYRYFGFTNAGQIDESIGQWNVDTRSFVWKLDNAPAGITRTSTTRIVGRDSLHAHIVDEDLDGRVLMDLTIRSTRRK